ncbi:sigma-70 family RNA polymerase sigma factor [Maribacter algarum]|uniref:Sigma-70 family RNA polymerase sigma factor n=1 Tax=Maribacter algarum (ex Zhang et al. 2020) TaxID=2578118 RepID=A0A5S3PVE6_9FLAO|nr:sigma-70 family RNA polymerase sigma factor [Maribacter algarum]TMM58920.1 sigma-70 family RNA polymerase sigma factor [Maribacter algarum]
MEHKIVDHLFRHHYGKMVAILTRFFGLSHIETIEDAVQDTFVKATLKWRKQLPDNPEAWLTKVAKNRTIDLLRSIKAEKQRVDKIANGASAIQLNELFLEHEIEDSQLRMIFVACHPSLKPKEQIAFALKTISGFSTKEIAAALLTKEDTITKRLNRAKKAIVKNNIQFDFPSPNEVQDRLARVMEVVYLTFNEGFHSTNKENLIREDLCGEAIRLCKLLLKKEKFRSGSLYALFALQCFHASRLESKTNDANEIVDIREQDRKKWFFPLIQMGNSAMNKAMDYEDVSIYHYEAAIAAEHIKAKTFVETNWEKILKWYTELQKLQPSTFNLLNMAIVNLQLSNFEVVKDILETLPIEDLEQRAYLFYGCYAEYYAKRGDFVLAISYLETAISKTSNRLEISYLIKKKLQLELQASK